jgi:hypothetical protein
MTAITAGIRDRVWGKPSATEKSFQLFLRIPKSSIVSTCSGFLFISQPDPSADGNPSFEKFEFMADFGRTITFFSSARVYS